MFIRSPRRKPTSVWPLSRANSAARLLGAETAATIGTPAASAFCIISKDVRPLSSKTRCRSGRRSASNAQPTTLSSALWRPTSSRSTRSLPVRSNKAQACRPPVRLKDSWAEASAPGNPISTCGSISQRSSTGGNCCRTASMDALLQIPQLEDVKTWRVSFLRSKDSGFLSRTLITLPSERLVSRPVRESSSPRTASFSFLRRPSPLRPGSRQCEWCLISTRSPAACTRPSVTRNPAASSRSSPGVRMTMATLWPSTRISNGSSAARQSFSSVSAEPLMRRIATSLTGRESKGELFTQHYSIEFVLDQNCPSARHNDKLILGNCVEGRFINPQVRHDQFRRRMRQPLRKRQVLVETALEHFKKYQVRVTGVLDVMQQRFLHVPDVSRLKVHRAGAVACRHHSHSSPSTDVVLPLVGIGVPMQF